jgi:ribulose-5-phosphate 4-epimerase/fuculose-1-phosphate aldolase
MTEQEGVIKYRLDHRYASLEQAIDIRHINAWRFMFSKLGLIGQDPARYQGLGFGNISQRLTPDDNRFLITGTQTGHLAYLKTEHFAMIEGANPKQNTLESRGPSRPSSEALTHASIYQLDPAVHAVIHVHSPDIWRHTLMLNLPHTGNEIAYGSVEMTEAVEKLFLSGQLQKRSIFSMLGHEDGIVAFGASLAEAAQTLITQYVTALAIEQNQTND